MNTYAKIHDIKILDFLLKICLIEKKISSYLIIFDILLFDIDGFWHIGKVFESPDADFH